MRVPVCDTPQPPLDSRFRGNDGEEGGNDGEEGRNDGEEGGMTCFVRRRLDSVPKSRPL